MNKISAWLFLLVALVWLLPLVNVNQLGSIGNWISVIAFVVIGVLEMKG